MAPPPPDRDAAGPQGAGDLASLAPLSQLQDNVGAEAEVLERFMSTNERQELLALVCRERYAGRFGTRHSGLL